LAKSGENPFTLDSKKITADTQAFLNRQNRYTQLARSMPEVAQTLQGELKAYLNERHESLRQKAGLNNSTKNQVANLIEGLSEANQLTEVTILFGSDTGTTEQVAKKFAGMCAERKVKVRKTCDLDEVSDLDDLKTVASGTTVIVMCATCGHGDFPQNASLEFYLC